MPVTQVTALLTTLRARIADHFLPDPPECLGVAVSGGSDSLALLVLLHDWHRDGGPEVRAVTVDHRLRENSADEAAQVAQICAGLGVSHETLVWDTWDGQGNLSDQARRARYRLMAEWAGVQDIAHVAVGHTANDQAETFLMRLAREAGVDGLSAMAARWQVGKPPDKVVFHRPLLRATREELRDVLRARGLNWVEDPTNDDPAYERVRARRALVALEPLGISLEGLATVAHHMAGVRRTLYAYVLQAARRMVTVQAGDLLIERDGFGTLPDDISRRLMQAALRWVSGAEYGARGRAIGSLLAAIRAGTDMTLSGCLITVGRDQLRVGREYNAVALKHCLVDEVWDGRWRLTGPMPDGAAAIAALGADGLTQCPDWRDSGLPGASLMAGPAVWRGDELLAAPLAGLKNGWRAELNGGDNCFFASLSPDEDV